MYISSIKKSRASYPFRFSPHTNKVLLLGRPLCRASVKASLSAKESISVLKDGILWQLQQGIPGGFWMEKSLDLGRSYAPKINVTFERFDDLNTSASVVLTCVD